MAWRPEQAVRLYSLELMTFTCQVATVVLTIRASLTMAARSRARFCLRQEHRTEGLRWTGQRIMVGLPVFWSGLGDIKVPLRADAEGWRRYGPDEN